MIRKRRSQQQVELNLAAMLDMAFQLLTFFILTFKPAPVEGQVTLRLPPPQGAVSRQHPASPQQPGDTDGLAEFSALPIVLTAGNGGRLGRISIAEQPLPVDAQLNSFGTKLSSLLNDPASPFDQVVVQVGSNLRYDELLHVVDVCTRQTLGGDPHRRLVKLSLVDDNSP